MHLANQFAPSVAFSGTTGNTFRSPSAIEWPTPSAGLSRWDTVEGYVETMANTTSAKKATRKIARRTAVNKSRRTMMRGSIRTVEEAIAKGDRDAAIQAMKRAEPELMRAGQRNIIHKNSASRKVSRLTHRIAKLAK